MSSLFASFPVELVSPITIIVLFALILVLCCIIYTNLKKATAVRLSENQLAIENNNLKENLDKLKLDFDKQEHELQTVKYNLSASKELLAALNKDKEHLTADKVKLLAELNVLQNNFNDVSEYKARLETQLKSAEEINELRSKQAQQHEAELQNFYDHKVNELKANAYKREQDLIQNALDKENALKNEFQVRLQSQQESFKIAQQDLESRLSNLSDKMLKERAEELKERSSAQFKITLDPFKEELKQFRELLDKARKESYEQSGRLSSELKLMQETQQTLSKQALDLTKALKSGGKTQGMWGELQLERVLDASGLTKGVEYEREVAGDKTLGENGRPDVVIRLPEHRSLIIDAKCSLTAYADCCGTEDEAEKQKAINAHIASIKNHIDGLSKRSYQNYRSLNSPSFVFMFVPLDGALQLAFNNDHSIYSYAEERNIYLVSPSTLIPSLKVVSNLWVLSRQNTHIRELAHEAQKIADKFDLVKRSYDDVIRKKDSFERSFTEFGDRLLLGRGNLSRMIASFAVNAPKTLKEMDGKTIDVDEESKEPSATDQPSHANEITTIRPVSERDNSEPANDGDILK